MINNYNICLSLILLLIFSSPILSQNAIEKKTISGVVTLEGTALKNVNILVSGTNYGTVTDKNRSVYRKLFDLQLCRIKNN